MLTRLRPALPGYVNTLLLQEVLAEPKWANKLTEADRRGLSPLSWTH
ncbi:Tn3 family transposase [Streptacidiphilus neutrinimicus]|nr:Tn3 family transposase [Streptacidiphilus neutrinimicus]